MDAADLKAKTEAAPGVERHDVEAVNAAALGKLYKSREQIYPKRVSGFFRSGKWFIMWATLGVYYLTPWIRWDRGPDLPDQAVLIDFAAPRFYFFFIEIWPQEIYYLTGLLVLAAMLLFLVTALFGRVWCGYTCPQTVWTDLFIWVERRVEGDRNARMRLDKQPWTTNKIVRKSLKHAIWLVIAMATGGAWIFYFHDAPDLLALFPRGEAPMASYFSFALLTATTYVFGGHMREQVCIYMCPWPRIQSALIDEDSLAVTYRKDRGEERGAHKKGDTWEGRGHCIDCKQCVVACPMGIDIRDGLQLECIQCALCIDACDSIMTKLDLPKGLIAYDTDINVARREAGEKPRYNFIRPRTVAYALILAAVGSLMLYGLLTRDFLELNVLRERSPNFVELSDGSVRNGYTVKIYNMMPREQTFAIRVEGVAAPMFTLVGDPHHGDTLPPITVGPDQIRSVRLYVTVPFEDLPEQRQAPLTFSVENLDVGTVNTSRTVFVTGAR